MDSLGIKEELYLYNKYIEEGKQVYSDMILHNQDYNVMLNKVSKNYALERLYGIYKGLDEDIKTIFDN